MTTTLEEHVQPKETFVQPSADALIRCEGIEKWYGSVRALNGVDFHCERNEIVGLVGDNGAGKSTLIKILSGAHRRTTAGSSSRASRSAFARPRTPWPRHRDHLPVHGDGPADVDRAEHLHRPRAVEAPLFGIGLMDRRKMAEHAIGSLTNIDLRTRSPDTPVEELSGGQRQGVAIARAMYFKSKVLILDEPTNHLSVKETNKVLDFVAAWRPGHHLIFISHNLHHIHPIADRIVAMARGEKIADIRKDDISIEQMTAMIV